MNTYRNSSFSKAKVLALAALLAGSSVAVAKPMMKNVGGMAQLDSVVFIGGSKDKKGVDGAKAYSLSGARFTSGSNIRRAEAWFNGNFANDLEYMLHLGFGSMTYSEKYESGGNNMRNVYYSNFDTKRGVKINQAYLKYNFGSDRSHSLTFGQFRSPIGMAWNTPDCQTAFMERANLSSTFLEYHHLGLKYFTYGDAFTFNVALAHKPIGNGSIHVNNNTNDTNSERFLKNDKYSGMLRFTYAPYNKNNYEKLFHLGFNAKYKQLHHVDYNNNDSGIPTIAWVAGPEMISRQSNRSIMRTEGKVRNVDLKHFHILGLEAAAKWNDFHLQSEVMKLRANYTTNSTDKVPDRTYTAFYVQGGWAFKGTDGTGRVYDAKKAVFKNPVPIDKCGVLELVGKYSFINLQNIDSTTTQPAVAPDCGGAGDGLNGNTAHQVGNAATGYFGTGKVHNYGIGLNWIINKNVALNFNALHTRLKFKVAKDRKIKSLGLRAQFNFDDLV